MTAPTIVTGAAGFAGSHLVDYLLSTGRGPIVGWYRHGDPAPARTDIQWQSVDILDGTAVHAAMHAVRPGTVYHCAGAAHVGQSWRTAPDTCAVNVRGTHHIASALAATRQPAVLLVVSSALVYAQSDAAMGEDHPLIPANPYGLSKIAQELAGTLPGEPQLRTCIARPFNHVGPRQSDAFVASAFARQIAEMEAGAVPPVLAVGNLDAQRDLTDVRDVVRAYVAIAEQGATGRPYNVCSGRALSVRHLLALLCADARIPIRVEPDPARFRPNDTPLVLGDPTRIRTELGWAPEIPFQQTLTDLLTYWRGRTTVA